MNKAAAVSIETPGHGAWWNTPAFVLGALLLAMLPLLWPPIPPLIDLPSHLGTYHIALDLASSPTLQRYYEFHWQVLGNLGVELLVIPLAKWAGVEAATKIVVLAIVLMTVAGMLWVAREIHGEVPPTAGFALPLAYGYPLHFGFLNYCLAMGLVLLALGLWLHLGRRGWIVRRAALFAPIALAVWLAHAIGWALLAVACASAELQRRIAGGERWPVALARAAGACATLAVPVLVMATLANQGSLALSGWLVLPEMAKWLLTLFRDRWMAVDLVAAALFFALLLAAATRRAGLRLDPALAVPALAWLAVFVLAPQRISDSSFVSGRIAPYALALLALAIDGRQVRPRHRQLLALTATAFFMLRIGATTASLGLYSASYDTQLQALDRIAPGSRIVAFSPVSCNRGFANWRNPRLYHLPSLAIVRKDAFVNTEWQLDGLQLLRVKYAAARPFDSDPSETVTLTCDMPGVRRFDKAMEDFPRQAFDYLWLVNVPVVLWPRDADLQLVWSHDRSALYRIVHGPRPAAG